MPPRDLPATAAGAPLLRSQLASAVRALGVREGAVLMVHASISRLGWVVGGSQTVVQALLDAVGPEGTLLAYAGWEDNPYHLAEWPAEWQEAYRQEMPGFDPALAEARHVNGRLPERIRTWPGAHRSDHPEANFVALGACAQEVVRGQARDDPYGPDSPLGRLVAAEGQLLLLGAPLSAATLLHHAESLVDLPGKRRVRYEMPIRHGDEVVWEQFTDLDTGAGDSAGGGALPYDDVLHGQPPSTFVERVFREAGLGRAGKVGAADSYLFFAREFVDFAVGWLTANFR